MALKHFHTVPSLSDIFDFWQKRLGLSDWTIRWTLEDRNVMGARHGSVRVFEKKTCARIWLLDPDLPIDAAEVEPYDPEVATVHEQLHCVLWTFGGDDGSVEDLVQEQAIHRLSKLLVEQERRIRDLESQVKQSKARKAKVIPFPTAA